MKNFWMGFEKRAEEGLNKKAFMGLHAGSLKTTAMPSWKPAATSVTQMKPKSTGTGMIAAAHKVVRPLARH